MAHPKIHIVATGGSISGIGPHCLAYVSYPELGQRLSIEEMLARIPEEVHFFCYDGASFETTGDD